jgi:hypothetical protein
MQDIALDSTNDLNIVEGDLVIITESNLISQNLKIRLLTFYGEFFRDTRKGVRYFEDILVKSPSLPKIETLLKNEILGTEGVNKLLSFALVYDASIRRATVSFSVDTTFGIVDINNIAL